MNAITPLKALNKAFRKVKPTQSEIDSFKQHLGHMKAGINPTESEAFHENLFRDFLLATYYRGKHAINKHERQDLAIHLGKRSSDKVGVIIEAKKPGSSEMATLENINTKAIQELLLYYLRERINHQNDEVKHLIITDLDHYFLFDAQVFDKAFAQDKAVVKRFKDWQEGRLSSGNTDHFYKEVAAAAVTAKLDQLTYTYIDLSDYDPALRSTDNKGIRKLVSLYKIFSPQHLLKQPFVNDSNTLDKAFYAELLHIIGLKEVKVKGKKLIQRKPPAERDSGSLLELTISKLASLGKLSRIPKVMQYGSTQDERLFAVGLELVIIWINRILFLKLLEAQLIAYNESDSYHFLRPGDLPDFDEVSKLFFDVLAKQVDKRSADLDDRYSEVPYLNSSLFEMQDLEHDGIGISNLDNHRSIAVHSKTVLKEDSRRLTGDLETLPYLLRFLNAYNFASEGGDDVQKDNKNLINASVLGLIFEKINGYKDGSFFTPGFITMYMCRETIRRAVVQKFNDDHGWSYQSIADVYNKIDDKAAANETINSLTICDPAVGSGHFLVSALNEVIHIKHELGILLDDQGHRLRDYDLSIENDELIIEDDRGELFQYRPRNSESQRVQRTIFREKQTIIESCLFGVDINPNSVKICQLRLWIELLKHSYYRDNGQLETLPNIDINIKCGNSLISRFGLEEDLTPALKKSQFTIESYKVAVSSYKRATDKDSKRSFTQLIDTIKGDFRSVVRTKEKLQLQKLEGEMYYKYGAALDLNLEQTKAQKAKTKKAQDKLQGRIDKLRNDIEEVQNNAIYDNAFEWRFEFPEVLDEEGKYLGFDVVIGNPPYIRIQDLQSSKDQVDYLSQKYNTAGSGNYDLYIPFVELGHLLQSKSGKTTYIIPHKFVTGVSGKALRDFIVSRQSLYRFLDFNFLQVFSDATTYTGLFFFDAISNDVVEYYRPDDLDLPPVSAKMVPYNYLEGDNWLLVSAKEMTLMEKMDLGANRLESVTKRIFQGLKTSADKIYIVDIVGEDSLHYHIHCKQNNINYLVEKSLWHKLIKGGDSGSFSIAYENKIILFPYQNGRIIALEKLQSTYPKTWNYLLDHETYLRSRESNKMDHNEWYTYVYPKSLLLQTMPKLFTPDIAPSPRISYDEKGEYMFTGGTSGGYGILPHDSNQFHYLQGILNSKACFWYLQRISTQMRGGWWSFEAKYIKYLPIPIITDRQPLSSLVTQIIDLKKEDLPTQHLEDEIDVLVYKLYDLTYDQVLVVDAAFAMTRGDYEQTQSETKPI